MSPLPMKADDWNERYADKELLWTARPNRFLVAETESLPPGRALDLACGEGRNAVWLAERGWRVLGVDFSEVAIGKAHQLAAARGVEAAWLVADLVAYVPDPGAYDLVILFYLQVPADERRVIVRRAADALAPGGTFLLVGHDLRNLESGHGGPKDPDVLYLPEDVAADLDGTGLELERAGAVDRPVETPEGERIAIDALVRARRS
jgi:SAM-dependent methyltransferase